MVNETSLLKITILDILSVILATLYVYSMYTCYTIDIKKVGVFILYFFISMIHSYMHLYDRSTFVSE